VNVTLLFTINSSIQAEKKIRIKNIVTLWNHCGVLLQEMEFLKRLCMYDLVEDEEIL
jgi:hypothetical protein